MAKKVALGKAIIWFPADEEDADRLAEQMALPTAEQQQISRSAWRRVIDRFRLVLDGDIQADVLLDEGIE